MSEIEIMNTHCTHNHTSALHWECAPIMVNCNLCHRKFLWLKDHLNSDIYYPLFSMQELTELNSLKSLNEELVKRNERLTEAVLFALTEHNKDYPLCPSCKDKFMEALTQDSAKSGDVDEMIGGEI